MMTHSWQVDGGD